MVSLLVLCASAGAKEHFMMSQQHALEADGPNPIAPFPSTPDHSKRSMATHERMSPIIYPAISHISTHPHANDAGNRLAVSHGVPQENFDDQVNRATTNGLMLLFAMFMLYLIIILYSLLWIYDESQNNSPIRFFTDQRYHQLATESTDKNSFWDTFNDVPDKCFLRVTGFRQHSFFTPESVVWRQKLYRPDISICFDIDREWLLTAPVDKKKSDTLKAFMKEDSLNILTLKKTISWNGWDDFAEKVKKKMHSLGHPGVIDVHLEGENSVHVYKNTAWSNFIHHDATAALLVLSVIGALWFYPYMAVRKKHVVETEYKVQFPIDDFWQLIEPKLNANSQIANRI